MKLTAKQEKFARLVAEGNTNTDAYDLAGFSQKQNKKTRTNNAYKLMQNNDIITTIENYKKEFTKNLDIASQITVERQLEVIETVVNKKLDIMEKRELRPQEVKILLACLQEENKLLGLYAPIKQAINTNIVQQPIEYKVYTNLHGYDDDDDYKKIN